jgi:pyrimidine operon attenuation protein/uracil phosphoribosyltransferase
MTKEVVDSLAMKRALTRMTYEIIEKNKGISDLVIIGIKTRGVYLAHRIAKRLQQLEEQPFRWENSISLCIETIVMMHQKKMIQLSKSRK